MVVICALTARAAKAASIAPAAFEEYSFETMC
jgi:hypothetical protein